MFQAVVYLIPLLLPIGTAEPPPTLTHQPVDCIVAGKFALIPACFEPAQQMARGRVYFQVEDSTSWFYVDVKSAQAACWSGVLPKPSRALLNRHVRYYVEVMTPSMDSTRTPDHAALVVRSADECHAPLVAAISSTGPAAVLPLLPSGFSVGGLSVPLVVAGAGGALGTAVVVARPGGAAPAPTPAPGPIGSPPSPNPLPSPTPSPTPSATPSPNATPSPTPSPSPSPAVRFPLSVSRQGTGSGAVTSAPTGISCGGSCVADYPEGSVVTLTPQADVGSVFVRWTGACSGSGACSVTMDAARSVSAQFDVRRFRLSVTKTPLGLILGSVTSSPAGINCGLLCATASATFPSGTVVSLSEQPIATASFRGWGGDCTGSGGCVVTMDGDKSVTVDFSLLGLIASQHDAGLEAGTPTLRSTLGVRGGRGDVALNGNSVLVAREGEGRAALRPLAGDNLVEARLLEGASGGFWQFDLVTGTPLQARALRVVTGELAAIGPDFVAFRLSGRPGERVSFVWTWGRAEK